MKNALAEEVAENIPACAENRIRKTVLRCSCTRNTTGFMLQIQELLYVITTGTASDHIVQTIRRRFSAVQGMSKAGNIPTPIPVSCAFKRDLESHNSVTDKSECCGRWARL